MHLTEADVAFALATDAVTAWGLAPREGGGYVHTRGDVAYGSVVYRGAAAAVRVTADPPDVLDPEVVAEVLAKRLTHDPVTAGSYAWEEGLLGVSAETVASCRTATSACLAASSWSSSPCLTRGSASLLEAATHGRFDSNAVGPRHKPQAQPVEKARRSRRPGSVSVVGAFCDAESVSLATGAPGSVAPGAAEDLPVGRQRVAVP